MSTKFSIEEIPFKQFEFLGLDKKEVLGFHPGTMNSLLSGNRTSLIQFNNVKINGISGSFPLEAKLSLERNNDHSVKLKFHPVQKTAQNVYDLSDKEIKHLKKNELSFVPKLISASNGSMVESLIMLDKTTNEYIAIDRDKLKAPENINGKSLTEQQKKDFVNGKPITINNNVYQLNPGSETGLTGSNLSSVKFKHGAYGSTELLIDIALFSSGLGHFVMLEHLASLLIHTKFKIKNPELLLGNKEFKQGLLEAKKEIVEKSTIGHRYSTDEIKEIIEKKVGEHIIIDKVTSVSINADNPKDIEIKASEKQDDKSNSLSIENEKPKSVSIKI